MSQPIKVDIWSDVQCPWCYIGKRRFERAVQEWGGEVDVTWHSFELAPDTPVDYEGSTADFLAERKGMPREQVEQMQEQITALAAGEGLTYRLDDAHQTNTVLAHELLHLARDRGLQHEMKERLLAAYFTQGRHVGRVEDLVELGAEVGLDPGEVRAALTDHRYLAAVKEDVAQAQAYGIQGVPFFVVDGRYGISGAQESATFVQALTQVAAERSGAEA